MELKELLGLLEDRLVQHDNNRKEVQEEAQKVYTNTRDEADSLEEKIGGEISRSFEAKEGEIFELVGKLNNKEGDLDALVKDAEAVLSKDQKYEIISTKSSESFSVSYKINFVPVPTNPNAKDSDGNTSRIEGIVAQLQTYSNKIRESMASAQSRLNEICNERRREAKELKESINNELEPLFTQEDARLQSVVKLLKEKMGSENSGELATKAKEALLIKQKYSLSNPLKGHSLEDYRLTTTNEISLECLSFEGKRPRTLISSLSDRGEISILFTFFNEEEMALLTPLEPKLNVSVVMWENGESEDTGKTYNMEYIPGKEEAVIYISDVFTPKTTYRLKMRLEHLTLSTQWSEEFEFITPEFKGLFVWKQCPDSVDQRLKYFVDENNYRITNKLGYELCTIIGNTPIPYNGVTSWGIRILASQRNDGHNIFIGVAPSDINQNEDDNFYKSGWYFNCYRSALFSGPPHNYNDKEYGPRKEKSGEYVRTGDSVGVVMDTIKGELSFMLNGVNYGVAFEGIPLDKPLVPCVLLGEKEDSIGVDFSEMKENMDRTIPAPSNITTTSGTTWDSISLTWDAVEGASFYQVEVDGSGIFGVSSTNTFTKCGLLEETEHTFRIRSIEGSSVSEWSGPVKGRSGKESFEGCKWRECPDGVLEERKYSIDANNPRIAVKTGYNKWYCDCCTIIGNTYLPMGNNVSWNIKILKSKWNNGHSAYVGVAPTDIDQNGWNNFTERGWYFNCYFSALYSGLPHKYKKKEYGPWKGEGKYVRAGDTVGVVMDTTKGELSFVLGGANLGVAYEGIPLDKPLVPCVIFGEKGDSAEIFI